MSRPGWAGNQDDKRTVCASIWLYCLAMSLPPVFGWSRYVLEGLHTSCSWDYTSRSLANRTYYVYLLTLGFLLPVAVILYCYFFITSVIITHSRGVSSTKLNAPWNVKLQAHVSSHTHIPDVGHPLSSSIRTAKIILVLVFLFLVSWTPYAVVTFIVQFGDPTLVTPLVASMPAIFAKASVVYNPIVYGLSHPHFRSVVRRRIFRCMWRSLSESLPSRGVRGRAAVSSPGAERQQPSAVRPDRHSEPLFRETVALWQPSSRRVQVKGHNTNKPVVTSEGFDTMGQPSSGQTNTATPVAGNTMDPSFCRQPKMSVFKADIMMG